MQPAIGFSGQKKGYRLPHTPPSLVSLIGSSFFPALRVGLHTLLLSNIARREPARHPVPPMKSVFSTALDLPRPADYRVFPGILNPR